MKLKVKNLGAVKKADISIKPFTVFVGANNTGKTWTSAILSSIMMNNYARRIYTKEYLDNNTSERYPELDQLVEKILLDGTANLNLNNFFQKNGLKYFNDVADQIVKYSNAVVGTHSALFEKTQIKLEIDEAEIKIIQYNLLMSKYSHKIGVTRDKNALLNIEKEAGNSDLYFFTSEKNISDRIPETAIKRIIYSNVFSICHSAYYHNIYSFPSERTGLMTIFLDLLPISKNDNLPKDLPKDETNEKIESSILLSAPCTDIITTMDNIRNHANLQQRIKLSNEQECVRNILDLVDILQNQILNGTIDYTQLNPELPPKVLYKLKNDDSVILEMTAVSSMVKDFAPIILYLRYFANKGDLIVIDEPEMNLHPEAQVKMIEFLAMLVNAGIYVVITTHSSYMVDHLTNLIKASSNKTPDKIKDLFFLKNAHAFISQDMVSVNLFGNNTVKNILSKNGAIDWETFSSISEKISEIYFEI